MLVKSCGERRTYLFMMNTMSARRSGPVFGWRLNKPVI
jgi:hypothetical protein